MTIVVFDDKSPADYRETVRLDLPPDYESSTTSRTNTAPSTTSDWTPRSPIEPPPRIPLWRRWLRSPIALSILFLSVTIIAVAIGLTVHFMVARKNSPANNESSEPKTIPDPLGPWSYAVKTFELPVDTQYVAFVSKADFVDGNTSLEVGSVNQTSIEADVSLQWKASMVESAPAVNSYYDPYNTTISVSCDWGSNVTQSAFVIANVTFRFPPHRRFHTFAFQSDSNANHCWSTIAANLTAGGISFDDLALKSNEGNVIIQDITATKFNASTIRSNIVGQVHVSGWFGASSENGTVSLVNLDSYSHSPVLRRPSSLKSAPQPQPF